MKLVATMLDTMLSGLQNIAATQEDKVKVCLLSTALVTQTLTELELFLASETFTDPSEEIHFFKQIKPQFDGHLIFYLKLISLEADLSQAYPDKVRRYRMELKRIKRYYRLHLDFYRYMHSDATDQDAYYFIRTDKADPLFLDDYYHAYNPLLFTRMSYKAAKLVALGLLSEYIRDNMADLMMGKKVEDPEGGLQWMAPKVYLAEIAYGLYAMKVFGNANKHQVFRHVCSAFGVTFANKYKVLEEIRLRKKNRTQAIDMMRMSILRQFDQDDEFSL